MLPAEEEEKKIVVCVELTRTALDKVDPRRASRHSKRPAGTNVLVHLLPFVAPVIPAVRLPRLATQHLLPVSFSAILGSLDVDAQGREGVRGTVDIGQVGPGRDVVEDKGVGCRQGRREGLVQRRERGVRAGREVVGVRQECGGRDRQGDLGGCCGGCEGAEEQADDGNC
jgi:hypothetical protein